MTTPDAAPLDGGSYNVDRASLEAIKHHDEFYISDGGNMSIFLVSYQLKQKVKNNDSQCSFGISGREYTLQSASIFLGSRILRLPDNVRLPSSCGRSGRGK